MNFRKRPHEEPEINLIPFIDVLMVILIFLMLTTTYSKFTELQLQLPVANADAARDYPKEVVVSVSSDGRYAVNQVELQDRSVNGIATALHQANVSPESTLIISADAAAPHQTVISVMEAARRLNMAKVTFATRKATDD
ncbi:MAG: biopolymer transporter ExbD [Brachymonas sp.]|jgi:biopolymer transport protein ExbD|nr:biopolymer transporter ExbD [Brachymonas sp.]MBP6138071.1 biopolymer transporter ExbD [Brachymonas sp.]MBP6966065.1 biopolymer transporter ExbD [Brachymonas sp.]MBP7246720.1 biopolymer transporter ExbD [Brachymonas sp.]MBP7743667.1 biopolymer transporter ExbD [Brachymonas sp.]